MNKNLLYYGDNLPILRKYVKDESIDLAYIDPPFNSKRNYNQIYNDLGEDDKAQAQAFTDRWEWDDMAKEGISQILDNEHGRFTPHAIELIKGLHNFLKETSLFAYLVSMMLRIVEIHRVLKSTGSFYLHCDPVASHYLKLLMDAVFGPDQFLNEIIWKRTTAHNSAQRYGPIHDVLLYYSKSDQVLWNALRVDYDEQYLEKYYRYDDGDGRLYWRNSLTAAGVRHGSSGNSWRGIDITATGQHWKFKTETLDELDAAGKIYWPLRGKGFPQIKRYRDELKGLAISDIWTDIDRINQVAGERLGYPTQKPEALLERIIKASSNEGDIVLDAYCGCGTTVAVAQRLKRQWIGIDITYQSISLILKRLEEAFGRDISATITLNGIPKDIASATALAHKKDDRVRKEFEKWAVLTYSNNRATINQKKGTDGGIDGTAYFMTSKTERRCCMNQ